MQQMGKASFRKRLAREEREALKSLQASMGAQGHDLQAWRPGLGTGGKISEKLITLFEDLLHEDVALPEAKAMIRLAAVAWNLAIEPEIGEGEREQLLADLAPEAQAAAQANLEQMTQRKLALFPQDRRVVFKTDAHLLSDGDFYFTAAAVGHEDGSGQA
jgi:hypothetical protein